MMSPPPLTWNEPFVFWNEPPVIRPEAVIVDALSVVIVAVVAVRFVNTPFTAVTVLAETVFDTLIEPVKLDWPLTCKATPPRVLLVTARAVPLPVLVIETIGAFAPLLLPWKFDPAAFAVATFEIMLPEALIDVGAVVNVIPVVVASTEIPVGNGSTLIPTPTPAPVTLIPPAAAPVELTLMPY